MVKARLRYGGACSCRRQCYFSAPTRRRFDFNELSPVGCFGARVSGQPFRWRPLTACDAGRPSDAFQPMPCTGDQLGEGWIGAACHFLPRPALAAPGLTMHTWVGVVCHAEARHCGEPWQHRHRLTMLPARQRSVRRSAPGTLSECPLHVSLAVISCASPRSQQPSWWLLAEAGSRTEICEGMSMASPCRIVTSVADEPMRPI